MLKTALMILTLGDGGAMHMALTEVDSFEDCAVRAQAVERILTDAGYTIEAMRCGQTDLALTPYAPGQGAADMRWHYHVTVQGSAVGDGFEMRATEAGACEAGEAPNQYCAISAQGPAEQ